MCLGSPRTKIPLVIISEDSSTDGSHCVGTTSTALRVMNVARRSPLAGRVPPPVRWQGTCSCDRAVPSHPQQHKPARHPPGRARSPSGFYFYFPHPLGGLYAKGDVGWGPFDLPGFCLCPIWGRPGVQMAPVCLVTRQLQEKNTKKDGFGAL